MNEYQVLEQNASVAVGYALSPLGDSYDGAAVGWHVAPSEEQRIHRWIDCRDRWLNAKARRSGKDNTRKAYASDWNGFFGFFAEWQGMAADGSPVMGLMPWQVGSFHAEMWLQALQEQGLANATVVRKITAMSSFYEFASYRYKLQMPGRGEVALWDSPNPFRGMDLPRVQSDPIFPTSEEVERIFAQIATRKVENGRTVEQYYTAVDLRNLAILAGMFGTTRRVTEWLHLKWGDIRESASGHYFRYRYKGGELKKQDLPTDLYALICNYLKAAGRWPIGDDEYIFVAHSDSARSFGQVGAEYNPTAQPLSESYAWSLLQRYGKDAGVDLKKCHPHALRHAGARYRRNLGADIWELQKTLGHKGIAVTERYTRDVLDEPEDKYGNQVGGILPQQYRLQFTK